MEILIKASQLILSLSILVVLHELGHFIPAKLFKTKVERFFLFFDPKFSLFEKKIGETVYGIGWLPLGGYVKIAGMIDESMDTEQMKQEPQPWEFRSKPAWQRLIIMLGGVTVNAILAVIIFAGIVFTWGESTLPIKNMKYGIAVDSIGHVIGLESGDIIKKIGDATPVSYTDLVRELTLVDIGKTIVVDRLGKEVVIPVTEAGKKAIFDSSEIKSFIFPRVPAIVGSLGAAMGAEKAGLKVGDEITAINGIPVSFFDEMKDVLKASTTNTVDVTILREEKIITYPVVLGKEKILGVGIMNNEQQKDILTYETKKYSFLASIPKGINLAYTSLSDQLRSIKQVFNPKTGAYKKVSGPIGIAKIFGGEWVWERFWALTGMLSIWLAFLNLLPIPALDGGHVVFTLFEMITGRKPSDKFLEYAQIGGTVLLFGLMILSFGGDIVKIILSFLQ